MGGSRQLAWAILACYFALVCVTALSHVVPLTFDEAWSFLEFSRHGVWHSLTHYPLPNNHIAFTTLQALIVREEFVASDPTFLRLGNLIWGAALLGLLMHALRSRLEIGTPLAALSCIALSLCSPLVTLYFFVARGYLLGTGLLLAALLFGALRGRRVATAVLSALATWTVPTFAFAVPGVLLALGLVTGRSHGAWRIAAQSAGLFAIGTLALYFPVMGDVLAQRSGWNEDATPWVFATELWGLLGNSGAFGLALFGNLLLLGLLAAGVRHGAHRRKSIEALGLLAPVASFLFVVGLLSAAGLIATPFVRTASFIPLFLWLALMVAMQGQVLFQRIAGVLIAFNAIAGLLLFTTTLGVGDPQEYPTLASLSPSPLARADVEWLAKDERVKMERDAVPVGRLYARRYGFKLKRVSKINLYPCAKGHFEGRFPPREQNRVAIKPGSRLICF